MPDFTKRIQEYLKNNEISLDTSINLNSAPTQYNDPSLDQSIDAYTNSAEGQLDLNPNLTDTDKERVISASKESESNIFSDYIRGVLDNTMAVANTALDVLSAGNIGVATATNGLELSTPTKKTYSQILEETTAVLEDTKALEGSKKLNKVWNAELGKYETWDENYGKLLQGNNLFGLIQDQVGGNKRLAIDSDGDALTLADNYVFYSQRDPETGEYVLAKTRFSNKDELDKIGKSVISSWGPKTLTQNVAKAFVSGIANAAVSVPSHFSGAAEAVTDLYEAYVTPFRGGRAYGKSDDSGLSDKLNTYFGDVRDALSIPASQAAEDNLFSAEAIASGVGQGLVSIAESAVTGGALRSGLGKLGLGSILTEKLGAEVAQKTFNRVVNFGAGSVLNFSEAYESSKQAGLSDENAALFGMAVGALNSLVESEIGSNALMDWATNGGNRTIAKSIFADVRKELGEDLSKVTRKQFAEALDKGVGRSTLTKIRDGFNEFTSRGVAGKMVEEATEEGLQSLVAKASESLYDATVARDKEIGAGQFGTEFFSKDTMLETLQSALIGGLVGGLGGAVSGGVKSDRNDAGILPHITNGKTEQVKATVAAMYDGGFLTEAQKDIYNERVDFLDGVWNNNKSIFSNLSKYDNHAELKAEAIGFINGASKLAQDQIEINNKIAEVNADQELAPQAKEVRIKELQKQIEDKQFNIEFFNNKIASYMNEEGTDKVQAGESRNTNDPQILNNEFNQFITNKRLRNYTQDLDRVESDLEMLRGSHEEMDHQEYLNRVNSLVNQKKVLEKSISIMDNRLAELSTQATTLNERVEEPVEVEPVFDNTPAPVDNINAPETVLNPPNEANLSKVDKLTMDIQSLTQVLESDEIDPEQIEPLTARLEDLQEELRLAENEIANKPDEDAAFITATTQGLAAIQSAQTDDTSKLKELDKLAKALVAKGNANKKLGKLSSEEFRPLYNTIQAEIKATQQRIAVSNQRAAQEKAAEAKRREENKLKATDDKSNAFDQANRFSVVYRPKALDGDATAYTQEEINTILRDTPTDQLVAGIEIVFQPIEELGGVFKAGRVQASTANKNTKLVDPKLNAVVWYNGKKLGLLPESDKFRINGVAIDWEQMTEANFRKYLSTTANFEKTKALAINLAKIESVDKSITPELFTQLGGKVIVTNAGVSIEANIGDRLRIDQISSANIPGVGYYVYDRTLGTYIGNPSKDMIHEDGVPAIPNVSERYVVLTQLGNGQFQWITAQQPQLTTDERDKLFTAIKKAKEVVSKDSTKATIENQKLNNLVFIAGQSGQNKELVITTKGAVLLQTKVGETKDSKEITKLSDLDIKTLRKPLSKNPDLKEVMDSLVVNVTAEVVKSPQLNIVFDSSKVDQYLKDNTVTAEVIDDEDPFAGIDTDLQSEMLADLKEASTPVQKKSELEKETITKKESNILEILELFDEYKNLSNKLKLDLAKELSKDSGVSEMTLFIQQRVMKTRFKQAVNAAIAKLNPSGDPAYSISPTSTEDVIKLDGAKAWIAKNLPNIPVADIDTLVTNIKNSGITWGAFADNVIYLSKNADKGTEYHEAFHAVYRLLLDSDQKRAVTGIAKSKYGVPSAKQLNELRAQSTAYTNMTMKELQDLWYEEKMADDFKAYSLNRNEGSKFKLVWRKLMNWMRAITGNQDELEALFSGINTGRFANARIIGSTRLPAFSIYTKGIDKEGNIVYTSQKEAKKLSTTIAGLTQKLINEEGFGFEEAIDRVIENQQFLYSLDNPYIVEYTNTMSDAEYDLFENRLLERSAVLSDPTNIEKVKEDVRKYFQIFNTDALQEEDNADELANEVGDRFDVDPWSIGGVSSLSQAIRGYIGFATYTTKDEFGQDIEVAVDGFTVYKGLTRALAGLDENQVLERFKHYSDFNEEARAVFNKLVSETGIDENNLDVIPNNDTLRKFVNAFKNESVNWMTILYDRNNGKANVIEANRRSSKMIQFNNWANNFFETSLKLKDSDTQKKLGKAVSDVKIASNINEVKSKVELLRIADGIKRNLSTLGIELSHGYIVFSLVKKQIEQLEVSLPQDLVKLYNNFQRVKGLYDSNSEDLTNINREIQDGFNPYEVVIDSKNNERGAITRLEGLAEANAIFDETVIDSTFQNADGKTVYSILNPSFGLVKLREMKDSSKRASYLSDEFISPNGEVLNHLLSNENSDLIFSNLNQAMFDGFRETNLAGENAVEGEGLTFGKFDGRTYLLGDVALFTSNRKKIKSGNITVAETALFNINQMEASNTGYLVSLPVETLYTKNGITDRTVEILKGYMAQEFMRINRVANDKNQIKYKGYNMKEGDRGFSFTEFKDIPGIEAFTELARKEGSTLEDFNKLAEENNLAQSIKDKLTKDIDQMLGIYSRYGLSAADFPTNSIKQLGVKDYFDKDTLDLRTFVGDMYLNQYVNTLATNNLLLGDYAKGIKSTVDWFKRAKGIIGSGKDLGAGTTKVAVYKEPTALVDKMLNNVDPNEIGPELDDPTRSVLINDMLKSGELSSIDVSDAQSYVTLDHKKLQLQRWGRFSDEIARIYNKIDNGIKLEWAEVETLNSNNAALNSAKTVVYDGEHFLKLSEFPLTPALVGATDSDGNVVMGTLDNGVSFPASPKEGYEYLYNMYKSMVEQGVDQIMPESASKMVTKNPAKMAKDGNFDFRESITEIDNRFKRLQVETPSGKTKITHGTQLIQLVDGEQEDTLPVDFSYNEDIKTLGDLRRYYRELLADVRLESFKGALQSVIDEETNEAKVDELAQKFYQTVESSGGSETQLRFFQPDENGRRKYNWNLGPVINKAEQLFLAHFSKGVLSQKVYGLKLSLVSDMGIKYKGRDLQHMVADADGNYYSECILPAFAEDLLGKDPSDEKISEVLKMFGIRIPTQDKHSMISLKVVQFLPAEFGSVGIFPKQLVLLSGADFDIDSIYIHRKDYVAEGVRLVPTNSANNQMVEAEIKFLTNDFVRNGAALIPATMDSIKGVAKEINSLIEESSYTTSPNTPVERFKANRGNSEGKSGIGPVALFNITNSFLTKDKVKLAPTATKLVIDDKSTSGFDTDLDLEGNRKNDNLSTLLSAMTDNAKEQLASKLNLTEDLLGVASYMLSIGIPMRQTMLILNQPTIRLATFNKTLNGADNLNLSIDDLYALVEKKLFGDEKVPDDFKIGNLYKNLTTEGLLAAIGKPINSDTELDLIIQQIMVSEFVERLSSQARYVGNISTLTSLNKGLKSTFVENNKFKESIDRLQLGMFLPSADVYDREEVLNNLVGLGLLIKRGTRYVEGPNYPALYVSSKNPDATPFDARLTIINDPATFQNILIENKVINDIAKRFFISETPIFRNIMKGFKGQQKDAQTFLTSYLGARSYERYLGDTSPERFVEYNNTYTNLGNLMKDSERNIGKSLEKLKKNKSLHKDNKLIRMLKLDKSSRNSKVVNITFPTRIKDPDLFNQLSDDYTSLFLNPETKQFAIDLYHYVYFKDGLQFKNNSPINIIGNYMFNRYSEGLDILNEKLLGDGNAFRKDIVTVVKDAMDSYAGDVNTYKKKSNMGKAFKTKNGVTKVSFLPKDSKLSDFISEDRLIPTPDMEDKIENMSFSFNIDSEASIPSFNFDYSFIESIVTPEGNSVPKRRYRLESFTQIVGNDYDNPVTVTVDEYIKDIIDTGGINNYGFEATYIAVPLEVGDPAITGGAFGYTSRKVIKEGNFNKNPSTTEVSTPKYPTLKLQPDNIEKILKGSKTATSRTFKVADGTYQLDNNTIMDIKGVEYPNISNMKNPEAWAKAEGFDSLEDMSKNAKFQHTKDFISGKRGLFIYTITNVRPIETTQSTAEAAQPVAEVENNLEMSENSSTFVELDDNDTNLSMYEDMKEDMDPFAGYEESPVDFDNLPDDSIADIVTNNMDDFTDADGLPLCDF